MAKTASDAKVDIVLPTAINIVLLVNENIVSNLLKAQSSDIELPSIYKLAFMVINETDEIAVVRQGETA